MEPQSHHSGSKIPAACLLILTFCVLLLIYGRIVIESDGITYYALSVSMLRDHDFDLRNQYEKMPEIRVVHNAVTGKPASMYSCGIALLYAPFLWIMDGLGGLIPSLAQWRPYAQSVRFPFPDTLGIFVASSIYSFLAILFTTALLVRSYHASFGTAAFLALMVFIGTPLAFYTFCSPSFIHAADSLLVAAAFYFAVFNEADSGKVRSRNLLTGFFLALSVMLRNNNIVLILPIVGGILFFQRAQGWRRIMITGLEIFAGALPVLMMHAYFNWTQYGRIFATGYRVDLSQEGLSQKWGSLGRFHTILTNPSAGIFVWAPITFLAIIGLVIGTFRKRRESIVALLCIVIVIVSIRFAGFSWTGVSFGQRYLLHLFVFFAVGLYELVILSKRTVLVLGTVCALWSFLLWNAYMINFASPQLRSTLTIQKGRELTPPMLFQNTQAEYIKAKKAGTKNNLVGFWWDSLGARPYPTLIHIVSEKEHPETEGSKGKHRMRKKRL